MNLRRAWELKPAGSERYSTGSPERTELHPLVSGGQKAATPLPIGERLIVRITAALRNHHDESGQILVLTAQTVGEP